ncbi:histidine phosphotransferase family protein [Paracoccus sp. Z330]|uniref:Histidine phosphotransferase family protein n=1 Tax=Paracoccus onchidii TaxID=3017813 RepID=A0ABT4ZJE3_9RHOB|nr:histidine phosphotransferase family protein [Paracoccus onchidii]MDB6179451.1 histidine phosphotransferase family protein [Paracoccus onchidii]
MTFDTTQITPGDLAALLGSRLCHDLVSPLGAIGNGVELLEMSPDFPGLTNSPELRLIAESVAAARGRIQAFRMAFGQSRGGQRVSHVELKSLVDGAASNSRLKIDLNADGDFSRDEIRMLMLALMCLETAMPWGGRVVVLNCAPGWKLVAEADRMKQDPELWSWLDEARRQGARAPLPSEVQFALLAEAAQSKGRKLTVEMDDQGAELTF